MINEEEKRLQELGYTYVEKGEWSNAIETFKKILEIRPNNVWVRIELAKLHRNETKFDSAEKTFRELLIMSLTKEQAEEIHRGLGEVYRMIGKYELAVREFEAVLKVNPDNEKMRMWLEKTNEVIGFRKKIPPYRIFFTWGMHYQCNYRCSYCHVPRPEKPDFNQEKKNQALYLDVCEWLRIWHDIYKKYGRCRIRLDGGEPSIYPSFTELAEDLSQIHSLQINTNLSFDVETFAKRVKPDRVRIDASFHPEFVILEDFLHKVIILKESGFKIVVSCVGYPPCLKKMKEYKRPFENIDVPFIILPYYGDYNGETYPLDFKKEEIFEIYRVDKTSDTVMNWKTGQDKTTKGKLCRMGHMYGRIYPNGDVYRCCAKGGTLHLGNLRKGTFQLLDEPFYCSSDDCPCWKSMIVGEESRWTSQWIDDWELPPR